jgi:CheY-like chemotaxis protein
MAYTLGMTRKENRVPIRHSLAIQEEERRILARELHDEAGQSLTAIKLMSSMLRRKDDPPDAPAAQIMALCDRLFGLVRAMMRRLRPMMLEDLGLLAALEDLIEPWRVEPPRPFLHLLAPLSCVIWWAKERCKLYRVVQEALTNVIKHAHAGNAWISLNLNDDGAIEIVIRDDGKGFDIDQPHSGFGLSGIRERVAGLVVVAHSPLSLAREYPLRVRSHPRKLSVIARVKVMLVDDHAVVRAGYRLLLSQTPDIEVVAEAETGEEACDLYWRHQPDVVVMDLNLPGIEAPGGDRADSRPRPRGARTGVQHP